MILHVSHFRMYGQKFHNQLKTWGYDLAHDSDTHWLLHALAGNYHRNSGAQTNKTCILTFASQSLLDTAF
jgi:hypothetical protein